MYNVSQKKRIVQMVQPIILSSGKGVERLVLLTK